MIYIFLAPGFEETEATTPLDFLRRAGANIQSVGVGSDHITGANGITLKTDITTADVDFNAIEAVILPGGQPGTTNLEKDETVQKAIDVCAEKGALIGAICAAPTILGHKGLLKGKTATCYPGNEGELIGANYVTDETCTDGNIVTARGPGVSQQFGFALVKFLYGEAEAESLKKKVQW